MAITSVTFTLNGETRALLYDSETGQYTASFAAPRKSSWFEDGHVYTGTVDATVVDDLKNVSTDAQDVDFRVLEDDKPSIVLLYPERWRFNTDGTPVIRWLVRDSESGVDTDSVTIKLDGVSVSGITFERQNDQDYLFEWSDVVAEGRHTATFEAKDYDGNEAESVTVSFVVVILITDRTASDVARVHALAEKIKTYTATEAEIAEWMSDPKGAYNAVDLNRVGYACEFLHEVLTDYGFTMRGYVALRTDWQVSDIPSRQEMETYLSTVAVIRDAIPARQEIPATMTGLDYNGANDIERALLAVYELYRLIGNSLIYSGEFYAGENL